MLGRLRRRPDRWAVPGERYECSPRCGYLFELRDGVWWGNTNPEDYPDRWGKLGAWADIEEFDGDCAAYLQRTYGGPEAGARRAFFGALQGR